MTESIRVHEECGTPLAAGSNWCDQCLLEIVGDPVFHSPTVAGLDPVGEVVDAVDGPWVELPGGLRIDLGATPLMLGRLSDDERIAAALNRDEVSRWHAELLFDGSVVWLKDLGSTNGTWLTGRRIAVETRLPAGDVVVGLGSQVRVIVHVPGREGSRVTPVGDPGS